MRVLSTGLAALLGLGLASTASAQFNTQTKPAPPKTVANPTPKGGLTTVNPNAMGGMIALTNDCTTPTVIAGPGVHPFDTTTATTSGFNGGGTCAAGASTINQDIFWQWTAPSAGSWIFETCDPLGGFDTKLSVHAGIGCAAVCVGYNDDACSLRSRVTVNVASAGDTFVVQVGGFGSGFGAGILTILPPPTPSANDDCATPTVIAGAGPHAFNNAGDTTGAQGQNEALCYFFGSTTVDRDLWYTWTAPTSDNYQVRTCTQTTVDTKLAVYPGAGCPIDGTSIACNDDACGLQSALTFAAVAGSTYTIQLGTFPGAAGGNGTFSIDAVPPGSGSDNCATAEAISGTGLFSFTQVGATTGTEGQNEALCYAFSTSGIGSDVWYVWTAPCTGTATLTTCGGATTDTKIAAYPGNTCPIDGTSLACNDDFCGLQSSIDFPVTMGSTYMLQIGSFPGGSTGSGQFTLSCSGPSSPAVDFCNGDGSGTLCPCGNNNDGSNGVAGCSNSAGAGGGKLAASGTASIAAGDLVLAGSTLQTGQAGLYLQGNNATGGGNGVTFGDGLRCAGGGVVRLQVRNSGMTGSSFTTVNIGAVGGVAPGDVKRYQLWFRDTAGPCGSGFNFTNGLEVTWMP